MTDTKPSDEERVRTRAYALWEQDGRPDGQSDHHWHRAKSDVEAEDAAGSATAQEASPRTGKKRKSTKASEPHPGMLGDGTEEQNLNQEGDPSARITEAEVREAFTGGKTDG